MRKTFILAALLCAACSSDPASDPASDLPDAGTAPPDTSIPSADTGDNPDEGTSTPDAPDAPADLPDTGGEPDMPAEVDMPGGASLYVGSTDPYEPGPLDVEQVAVAAAAGPGSDLLVFAPTADGLYPVIVFQHGFLLRNRYFSTLLTHVASHGFVVVAPQMYEPSFISAPTAAEEAVDAAAVWNWVSTSIATVVQVDVDPTRLGLAGHSRGGKVVWLGLEAGFGGAVAAAGIDPVDGTGGFLGNEARVLAGGLAVNLPSLFIGAELSAEPVLGQVCAPAGDDHAAFYAAASPPAYWAFAEGYGHLDMLDADPAGCGVVCSACAEGPADGGMRRFVGGQLVAFFRWQLQGAAAAEALLQDAASAPITAQFQSK